MTCLTNVCEAQQKRPRGPKQAHRSPLVRASCRASGSAHPLRQDLHTHRSPVSPFHLTSPCPPAVFPLASLPPSPGVPALCVFIPEAAPTTQPQTGAHSRDDTAPFLLLPLLSLHFEHEVPLPKYLLPPPHKREPGGCPPVTWNSFTHDLPALCQLLSVQQTPQPIPQGFLSKQSPHSRASAVTGKQRTPWEQLAWGPGLCRTAWAGVSLGCNWHTALGKEPGGKVALSAED